MPKKIDINPLLPFTYVDLMYIMAAEKKKASGAAANSTGGRCNRRVNAGCTLESHSSVPSLDLGEERSVNTRDAKALELADRGRVIRSGNKWLVFSLTSTERYEVTLDPLSCTCTDFETRHEACKHVLAARIIASREEGEPSAVRKPKPAQIETPPIVWPRKTYTQDWPNYDLSQQNEKAEFQRLLADLCSTIIQPPAKGGVKGGRPAFPLCDTIFATVFKIYSTLSGRRFATDLREAQERGYVSQAIHYSTIARCLEDKETSAVLIGLIEASALPFVAIETEFAVDSSGFSSSQFVRWYDAKWGRMKSEHAWVKAHAMTGTTTHVIASVIISDRHANDSPHFAPLVKTTAKNFTIKQATGDKAFCSSENFQVVEDCGGTAYFAFRKSATGWSGGIYERMFHQFSLHKDEYLAHYHRRSNIESTFSAVKRLMGSSVRSKSETAMRNEVLGKLLAYNITLLVHAIYELDLEPRLGGERDDEPMILPMIQRG